MKTNDELVLTMEQLAENPAVDPKIVKNALKMRFELERLGVWENSGPKVVSPYKGGPVMNSNRNSRRRFTTRNR